MRYSQKKIKRYLELNTNKKTAYQNLWDTVNAVSEENLLQ